MILYDGNPQTKEGYVIASFVGNRLLDKDDTVFESFKKAKAYARKQMMDDIKELTERLRMLDSIDEGNCPVIINPFW